jgi:hypothetical protein
VLVLDDVDVVVDVDVGGVEVDVGGVEVDADVGRVEVDVGGVDVDIDVIVIVILVAEKRDRYCKCITITTRRRSYW